jgi:hypothetical protein
MLQELLPDPLPVLLPADEDRDVRLSAIESNRSVCPAFEETLDKRRLARGSIR